MDYFTALIAMIPSLFLDPCACALAIKLLLLFSNVVCGEGKPSRVDLATVPCGRMGGIEQYVTNTGKNSPRTGTETRKNI